MKSKRSLCYALLTGLFFPPIIFAMGLRSFVALPVEKGGSVLRATAEHNADTEANQLTLSTAYGISHRQTLLFKVPYRLSSGDGHRTGDVSALYRLIVRQSDTEHGTDRLGLLGGVVIPTNSKRDEGVQMGAIFTHYRGRNEIDIDVLYQQGLGNRNNTARYDLSWQHRIKPSTYPDWGIPHEWHVVTELGGRWSEGQSTVHQFTVGIQRVAKRWVLEGGVIQDLNEPRHTRFLVSVRFH